MRMSHPRSPGDGDRRLSGLDDPPFDTRFAAPVATHVVTRSRLHTQLTAGLACSCVLITAPAGWGKTLLVSSWLQAGGGQGGAGVVSARGAPGEPPGLLASRPGAPRAPGGGPAPGDPRNPPPPPDPR